MSDQSVTGERYGSRIEDAIEGMQNPRKFKGRGRKLRCKDGQQCGGREGCESNVSILGPGGKIITSRWCRSWYDSSSWT